jgi:hypothetical protein
MSKVADDIKKVAQLNRRTYQSPRIVIYGALRHLTAGGTGAKGESGKNPGKMA